MIDVIELQNEIISNPEHIVTILESMEFEGVEDKGKYYRFKNHGGDNVNACSILKNTLHYENFSHGKSGSIITLVQSEKHCNFPKALDYIAKWIGFKGREYKKVNIKKPFGGFYSNIVSDDKKEIIIPTYNEEDILPPPDCLSYLWLKDGVDLLTQQKWGIRLDLESDKIVIPARACDGSLVGAKFRVNSNKVDHNARWGMYKAYAKSHTTYGYFQNYNMITQKRILFIFEAEKSCLIMSSWNLNLSLAIGGHNISEIQVKQIRSLFADKILVCFDSDICEEEVEYEAKKLISDNNLIYKPRVGYLFDRTGLLMDKKDKCAPVDFGLEVFKKLKKGCTHWIN